MQWLEGTAAAAVGRRNSAVNTSRDYRIADYARFDIGGTIFTKAHNDTKLVDFNQLRLFILHHLVSHPLQMPATLKACSYV